MTAEPRISDSTRRIAIIGVTCSGKTSLARRIAAQLNIPHLELDALYWDPGWTPRSENHFRDLIETRTAGDA